MSMQAGSNTTPASAGFSFTRPSVGLDCRAPAEEHAAHDTQDQPSDEEEASRRRAMMERDGR